MYQLIYYNAIFVLAMGSEDDRTSVKFGGPLKGVLVHPKSKKVKKSVTWKEDGLECIKYFELDETERG